MNRAEQNRGRCTVYLLRHGDSRVDDVRRFIGRSESSLNEAGRIQAKWWHQKLAGIPFNGIFCSALQRAVETARIIVQPHHASVTILPDLNEINLGRWDGMPISEVKRLFPLEYHQRGDDLVGYRPPGGESFADLSARVVPAFEKFVQQSHGNLLIVGHAGVNRVILCHLLGMPPANLFRLDQEYGCLNILEYSPKSWLIHRLNIPVCSREATYLQEPALLQPVFLSPVPHL
jgi:probable phosphoglycerate mutase